MFYHHEDELSVLCREKGWLSAVQCWAGGRGGPPRDAVFLKQTRRVVLFQHCPGAPALPSRPPLPSSPEVHWSSHLPLLSSPGAPALPSHPPLKFTGAPALPCRRPLPLSPPSSPRAHQRCAPRVLGEWEHRCDCISAPPRLARDLLSGLAELGSRLPSVHFRCPSVWLSSPLLFCCGFVFVVSDLKEQPSFFFRGFGAGW